MPVVCKLPPLQILCELPLISLLMPVVRSAPASVLMPVWELFPLAILMPAVCERPLLSLLMPIARGVCAGESGFKCSLDSAAAGCPPLPAATVEGSEFFFFLMCLWFLSLLFLCDFFFLLLLHPWCFIVIVGIPSEGFEPVTQLEALFKLGKMVRPCHVTA